jgi:predicted Zn-dependent peptidase
MSEYFVDTLANGLRLVSVAMPHLHSTELVCYIGSGGRHEPLNLCGISHFLEHMLFRGAGPYASSRELEQAFEELGGAVNAATDAESICFHSRIHPDHMSKGLEIFAQMLRQPHLGEVEIERQIILEEAREDFNQQGEQTNPDNLMAALLWPDHPLGQPLIGTRESLNAIDSATLSHWHQEHYTPPNTVITCCGNMDRRQFVAAAQKFFGDWQGAAPSPFRPAPPPILNPRQSWVQDSDSQICLQLAFPMAGRLDPRQLHFSLLRRLLSWGGCALLPQRLREECGLTYAIEANCSMLADTGYMAIDLAVAPQNLVVAVQETLGVLDRLRRTLPDALAFEAARTSFKYDIGFALDQPEAMAVRYGWGLQANCLRTSAQDEKEIDKIDAAQIQQLCRELFTRDRLHLVVVGPWRKEQKHELNQLISSF